MKIMDTADRAFTAFACACLFAVMLIVGIDALGRNLADRPITGAYVLIEEYLMPAMIFPLISHAWAMRAHVGITLLRKHFPALLARLLRIVDILAGLAIFGVITAVGWENTSDAREAGLLTSGLIRWPVWLALVWMPLGSGLFCLRLLGELYGILVPGQKPVLQ